MLAAFFYTYLLFIQLKIFKFFEKRERKKENLCKKFVNKMQYSLHFLHSGRARSFIRRAHASRCADEQPAASDDTSRIYYVRHYGLSFARRSRRWSRIRVLTSRNNRSHRSLCPCYSYNYLQNNLLRTPRLQLCQPCDACPSTMANNCLSNASWCKRRPRAESSCRTATPFSIRLYRISWPY